MSVKVLYIEDNPNNMRLISKILGLHGHTMIEAYDGMAGINLAIRENPDLILLDIHLASIDGFEVMSRLRTMPPVADTPIVAVTAHATILEKSYYIASGFDDFLPKPVESKTLIQVITQLCNSQLRPVTMES